MTMNSYTTFEPFLKILPQAQQSIWRQLQPIAKLDFVLYGGTAIALRLGHRISVDFDFFCEKKLDKQKLIQSLSFFHDATVLQDELNTFSFLTAGNVKFSFFGGIKFGRMHNPEFTDDRMILVASLDDLMATKLKVVLQRIEAKDYQDIAAMLQAGVSLDVGLALAKQFYGNTFQPSESLKALVYFKGGDLDVLSTSEKNRLIQAVSHVTDLPTVNVVKGLL